MAKAVEVMKIKIIVRIIVFMCSPISSVVLMIQSACNTLTNDTRRIIQIPIIDP